MLAFLAVTLAFFAFGLLVGRWWSVALPVLFWSLYFLGTGVGVGARGLDWGWPVVLAFVLGRDVVATTVGVLARKRVGLLGVPTGWPLSAGRSGAALVAVAAVVVTLVPPVAEEVVSRPKSDFELEEVRRMRAAPLYYVGESFAGLPLTAIVGDPSRRLSFIYGDCEVPIGIDPGGCPAPLEVQNRRCDEGGTHVTIFADDDFLQARAREAIRPANRTSADPSKIGLGASPGCPSG